MLILFCKVLQHKIGANAYSFLASGVTKIKVYGLPTSRLRIEELVYYIIGLYGCLWNNGLEYKMSKRNVGLSSVKYFWWFVFLFFFVLFWVFCLFGLVFFLKL